MRSYRLLLLSSRETLAAQVLEILKSAGHLACVVTAANVETLLRLHRTDLVIVDMVSDDANPTGGASVLEVLRKTRGHRPRTLLLTGRMDASQIQSVLSERHFTNFLATDDDARVDSVELTATVAKILSPEIFGLERYLRPSRTLNTFEVTGSGQIEELADAAERMAREAGFHARVAEQIAVAMDELLSNAIYNAAVDPDGIPRYAHLPRTVPVELRPSERVFVQLGTDGRRLGLLARDPFGRLEVNMLRRYLTRCFSKSEGQVEQKAGGAGLGLYTIFNIFQSFVVNLSPGVRTESIGLVDVTRSYKAFRSRARSFNVFVTESS